MPSRHKTVSGADASSAPETSHTSKKRRTKLSRSQLGAVFVLLCCQTVMILDTSSFNIALAAIGTSFSVSADEAAAVNLGYVVAVAVMIPLAGWLGERFGTVRILACCLSVMIVGSIIGATAASLPAVVAGRVAQGIGGGGIVPLAFSLIFRNFEPQNRLKIMATLALPVSIAPALGPFIGGILVDQLSWRWVFLLNIPISLTGIIVALTLATEVTNRAVRPLDIPGALLTIVGFGASVLGVQRLATGNEPLQSSVLLAVGLIALAVLIPVERRKGAGAFLDINLFRYRTFSKTTSITMAHSVGFMGFGLAGPLLLQTQLGATAMQAGFVGVAGALGPIISSRFARPLIMGCGAKAAIAISQCSVLIGLGVNILGYAMLSIPIIMVGMFLCGCSSLITIMACQNVGFAAVPETNLGDATTLDGTGRQVSNAIGISVVTAMLAMTATIGGSVVVVVAFTIGGLALFHVFALIILSLPGALPVPGAKVRTPK